MQSNKSGLLIINAGIFTQLQDQGRFNQSQQGISQGGFSDELAANWANYLLGNANNAAVLEICFGQVEFEATSDLAIALTGAPMNAELVLASGKSSKQVNNCSFILKRGQRLKLSYASSGVRSYLAIQGGFLVSPKLGSVSTVKRNAIGGLAGKGEALNNGDFLPVAKQCNRFIERKIPQQFIPDYTQPLCLALLESYQCHSFAEHQKETLYNSEYEIDQQTDRMGMRLKGKAIKGDLKGIVSEGIALASVQIPADGQPIILLQDRQTLGGYPKIGCIARCDVSLLAQQSIGKKIRFKRGNLQQEQQRYLTRLKFFNLDK